MKLTKKITHFIIAFTSVSAFLTGWVSMAHSLKPIQPTAFTHTISLQPLEPVGAVTTPANQGKAGLFSVTPRQRNVVFRTRGS